MTALEEIKKAATQEEIAAAWSAWQSRHGGKLGPGPAFVEAINAALALRLPTLESLQRENDKLRQFLFPYADRTDISGISWDGKYLIGDKASIMAFHEMKNRGEQIDVYKRAYDQNEAALKVRAEAAEAEVRRLRNKVAARVLTDAQLIDEIYAVDAVIDAGFGEGGGSPGEWWYERADELDHERKRRELENQLQQHNSGAALASTGGEHHAE